MTSRVWGHRCPGKVRRRAKSGGPGNGGGTTGGSATRRRSSVVRLSCSEAAGLGRDGLAGLTTGQPQRAQALRLRSGAGPVGGLRRLAVLRMGDDQGREPDLAVRARPLADPPGWPAPAASPAASICPSGPRGSGSISQNEGKLWPTGRSPRPIPEEQAPQQETLRKTDGGTTEPERRGAHVPSIYRKRDRQAKPDRLARGRGWQLLAALDFVADQLDGGDQAIAGPGTAAQPPCPSQA